MKIEINIDMALDETLVKIYAPSYNQEVRSLEKSLEAINKDIIVGFKDDDIYILDYKDIIRFFTKNKKIYIEGKNCNYISRLRLYEIEERLDKSKFIRISRYEIINIDYVKKLDLSFKGTIAVEFKNGNISYVSRRFLKDFKKVLGF